ncbi:Extracellular serine/threonine protein kinase four-jointed [Frankliniella fusca]|uniref:Extracellular serine/threonine protein kinase four-jointed n=1 Tax=Frankliniella fusca TaxID=407009 RepID=A0AAE1HFF9_9NEOP|nr:Extracellular serine/threonine protein kinase four-jointed [Frankliniella fusca]
MCEHVMPFVDKDKRRPFYPQQQHHLVLLSAVRSVMAWHERRTLLASAPSSRSLFCFLTASFAFALGLVVGVMIPLCLLPRHVADAAILPASRPFSARLNASAAAAVNNHLRLDEDDARRQWRVTPNRSADDVVVAVVTTPSPTPRFPSVSFVSQFAASPPVLASLSNSSVAAILRGESPPSDGPSSSAAATSPSMDSSSTLRGGIYWGRPVEDALPRGFTDAEVDSWRRFTRTTAVVKMEEGCGRMQNRLLTFADGTASCCRYRQNTDQIQGELFSFLLGHLLGLRNLAPSTLAVVRTRDPRWGQVREHVSVAEWAEDKPVVLTRFLPSLQPAHIPRALRGPNRRLHPPDVDAAGDPLTELAQWSDLVVFDYLTANLDRVVNNLYNQQWNKGMMDAPAHNLARDPATGLLVFLDNESGLLHGYRLLRKYENYHRLLLDQLCVFRRPTVDALRRLHRDGDVGDRLHEAFLAAEPQGRDVLPGLPAHNVKVLRERIKRVLDQVELCEARYGERTRSRSA